MGEQIELDVEGRNLKWTVAEIFKDHSARAGIDVFTVRVDETDGQGTTQHEASWRQSLGR